MSAKSKEKYREKYFSKVTVRCYKRYLQTNLAAEIQAYTKYPITLVTKVKLMDQSISASLGPTGRSFTNILTAEISIDNSTIS